VVVELGGDAPLDAGVGGVVGTEGQLVDEQPTVGGDEQLDGGDPDRTDPPGEPDRQGGGGLVEPGQPSP
jgi:hypothetical protein